MLELAKQQKSGFVLLSTSRVYAIKPLANLPVTTRELGFEPAADADLPSGVSICGIAETFSTEPPVSLYGSSKLASECIALEYGDTFNFPVWSKADGGAYFFVTGLPRAENGMINQQDTQYYAG
jgi:CDP-paratose 2-epimerase